MAAPRHRSNQRDIVWLTLAAAGVLVLTLVLASWIRDSAQGGAQVTFAPVATATPAATVEVGSTSTPSSTPAAASPAAIASPHAATPVATSLEPVGPGACTNRCLVRLPVNDETNAVLEETGERPSYESSAWQWSIIAPGTVEHLQASNIPVLMVNDSPETLYLYVTRLPEGTTESPVVREFGEVLDSVNGHSVVRVDSVPAKVTAVIDAGVWVEKLVPAAPLEVAGTSAGRGASISGIDLGVLLPEVDAAEIERTITVLQAMSSTDGTGIGTRHYTTTGNVMATEYLFTRLESYGLNVWYEDFVTPEGFLSANVIGEIPGRDQDAIYGVMAHLDSTATSFSSAPGADDNGTGIASLLEIARILSGYELEHPVHVIFVNAEETAILGSMAYARNAVQEEMPLEGVFNIDSVGSGRHGSRLVLNADERSAWMMDLLVRINNGYGLGQDILVRQNPAIVADDSMLRNEGLEAVMVARELYGMSPILHTDQDILENVSIPNTVSTAQLVLLTIAALVQ